MARFRSKFVWTSAFLICATLPASAQRRMFQAEALNERMASRNSPPKSAAFLTPTP